MHRIIITHGDQASHSSCRTPTSSCVLHSGMMMFSSPKQEDFESPLPLPLLQPTSPSPAPSLVSSSDSSGSIFQVVGFSNAEGKKITHQSGTYEDKKKNIRHLLNAGETLPVYLQVLGPARRTELKKLVLQLRYVSDEHQQLQQSPTLTIGNNGYDNTPNNIHTNGMGK